jgi:hypothetical protein
MTDSPLLVTRARDWIAKARSFHDQQLNRHRRVRRFGKTRLTFTTGQAVTNWSAFFVAGWTGSAGLPDLAVLGVLLGGFLGGKYVFPVPDSSLASRRGPADVVSKSAMELDSMTPEEIRVYENNMVLKHRLKGPGGLGVAQALQRQQEAARTAEEAAGMATASLTGLSLGDAQAFSAAAAQHERLKGRWLAYEVDPHLQFDFPAMSDTAYPATAAMIRAMRDAEQAKSAGHAANYRSAVAAFGKALTAAEAAAGVPRK